MFFLAALTCEHRRATVRFFKGVPRQVDLSSVSSLSTLTLEFGAYHRVHCVSFWIIYGRKANQSQDIGNKLDQWLVYAMFICSCSLNNKEARSTKQIFRMQKTILFPEMQVTRNDKLPTELGKNRGLPLPVTLMTLPILNSG